MVSKYAKEIFIRLEQDGEDPPYMIADNNAEDFAEPGKKVKAARYRLVEEVTVTSKTTVSVRQSKRRV